MASACAFLAACVPGISPTAAAEQGYESHFMFLWCDPHEEEVGFLDGNEQLQGLAHDAATDHWLISAGESMHCGDSPKWGIWKLPVTSGLVGGTPSDHVFLSEMPAEVRDHYFHIGDIDCFNGIVVVPVEGYNCNEDDPNQCCTCPDANFGNCNTPVRAAILFFNAQDLNYIGQAMLPGWRDLGWVAVNPADGYIYLSTDSTNSLERHAVDWAWLDLVRHQTSLNIPTVHLPTIVLKDENGDLFPGVFHNTQGGAFSESGGLFYLLVGACGILYADTDGISAFDTSTWRRVRRSIRCHEDSPIPCDSSCMDFRYYWEPDLDVGLCHGSEPEGIDVWDLDRDQPGRGPYRGQLHVGWLDNNMGQDPVTVWHLTNALYADRAWRGTENGRPSSPYNTVGEAHARACDGAIIRMKPGYYGETPVLTRRSLFVSDGLGSVVIGTAAP